MIANIIVAALVAWKFYGLTKIHGKNQFLFPAISVGVFYAGTYAGFFGIIFAANSGMFHLHGFNGTILGFLCIPIGLLFAVIFYQIMKYIWNNEPLEKSNFDDL